MDSAGKPCHGHTIRLITHIKDKAWLGGGKVDEQGAAEMRCARNGTGSKLYLMTDFNSALRYKRGDSDKLHAGDKIDLGTLEQDVSDLVIVRYKAPILVVCATGPDGTPVKHLRPSITYCARHAAADGGRVEQWTEGRRSFHSAGRRRLADGAIAAGRADHTGRGGRRICTGPANAHAS